MYNIANVVWQLVHYTVYGTPKSDNGRGEAESIMAILRPVNCIVDSPPSNICIIFCYLRKTNKKLLTCGQITRYLQSSVASHYGS